VWGREFLFSNLPPSTTLKTGTVALFFSLPIKLYIFHSAASALKKNLQTPFLTPYSSFHGNILTTGLIQAVLQIQQFPP